MRLLATRHRRVRDRELRRRRRVLAVSAVLVTGCSGDDGSGGDASAQLACREFYALANEADLLTFEEQRERIQSIWGKAQVSETPGIADAARGMLAAITSEDFDALEGAVNDMDSACSGVDPL